MKRIHSIQNMCRAAMVALSVYVFTPSHAAAEYCWKTGCKGLIGWIAINDGQKIQTSSGGTLNWKYQYDPMGNVFIKQGLPDVNSIAVTQLHGTPLLLPEEKVELSELEPGGFRIDEETKRWKNKPFPSQGTTYAFSLADGTKVKILGYDFTDKGHLFALVIVVEDGGQ